MSMEPLNTRTLAKAIEFAYKHEFTSIAIMLDCRTSVVALRHSISDQHLICASTYDRLLFANGSSIRLYAINDGQNIRGHRSNIVLVHSLVTDPLSLAHIQMVESSQHGHPGKSYMYINGLDDYYELDINDPAFKFTHTSYPVQDLGDLEPSLEILEYIGGASG